MQIYMYLHACTKLADYIFTGTTSSPWMEIFRGRMIWEGKNNNLNQTNTFHPFLLLHTFRSILAECHKKSSKEKCLESIVFYVLPCCYPKHSRVITTFRFKKLSVVHVHTCLHYTFLSLSLALHIFLKFVDLCSLVLECRKGKEHIQKPKKRVIPTFIVNNNINNGDRYPMSYVRKYLHNLATLYNDLVLGCIVHEKISCRICSFLGKVNHVESKKENGKRSRKKMLVGAALAPTCCVYGKK